MSDVGVVLLTLGESSTEAALASLERQSLPPSEVVVVRDVRPFHRAFNTGSRRVASGFFVQLDADMVLDPDCLERLRAEVRSDTGIVVAPLRDPLIGRAVGVKLFRTAALSATAMPDTISQDTDLGRALEGLGWKTVYAARPPLRRRERWRTLGEHRRDYAPGYTFQKYLVEGRRYRYRGDPDALGWHFGRLEASRHPAALIAQIALANGVFLEAERDLLGAPCADEAGYLRLVRFLSRRGGGVPAPPAARLASFAAWRARGEAMLEAGDADAFEAALAALGGCHGSRTRLEAKIALCRGLLAGPAADADGERRVLASLLAAGASPAGWRRLAARLGWRRR